MKINLRRTISVAVAIMPIIASGTSAQNATRNPFESQLFSIVPLRLPSILPQVLSGLTTDDKTAVLACRNEVIAVLQKVEFRQNALQHLTPELVKKYATSAAFAASLTEPESSLMATGISSFDFVENKRGIRLNFYVISFLEGMVVASEMSGLCRSVGTAWRIAELSQ